MKDFSDIGKPDLIEADPPDFELSWERRAFTSPDGQWVAVYHGPAQRRAGEMSWQLSLVESNTGVDRTPSALRDLSAENGLLCTADLRPWRFDGQMLALLPWARSPQLLNMAASNLILCESTGAPLTAQWAATRPLLLFVYFDRIELLDGGGRLVSTVAWESEENEIPYTGWTEHDRHFFLLRHPRKNATPQLLLFDPEHVPAVARTIELDPVRLVSYDASAYDQLRRDRLSLILEENQRACGALLDTWRQIRWDAVGSRLLLSIYRPVGPPFRLETDEGWACMAKENWLALSL